jgi:RHS repeat-associated protein
VSAMVNDYRVLQASLVRDPNGNRTEVAFDILGMVTGTAIMGKAAPAPVEGDTLAGFNGGVTQAQLDGFFDAADPHTVAASLLGKATTRSVYDLHRFFRSRQSHPEDPTAWKPVCVATLLRETHVADPLPPQGLRIQISFGYSDGFGRAIQKKIQAESGPLVDGGPVVSPRWVGSGWTILNNKGKPVRQYEPFFSSTHGFEFGVAVGVSPVLFYDPAERVIATLHPNHTYEKVLFDPWQQTTFDLNDTCAPRNRETGDPRTDPDIGGYVERYFAAHSAPWDTWRTQHIGGAMGQDERNAALRAEGHADTPTTAHFDSLGRTFLTIARNRVVCPGHDLDGTEESFGTRVELDIEGNQRAVADERKLPVNDLPVGTLEQRVVMRYAYDMLGNRIHQESMEAGARWILNDVAGKTIRSWDSRGHNFAAVYDELRRPVEQTVRGTTAESDQRTLNRDMLFEKIEYGERLTGAEGLNLRTRIYRHFDSAGVATNAQLDLSDNPIQAYDFKGNLLRSTRRFASDYTAIHDWLLNPQLEAEVFEGSTRYDALNRPIQTIAPHSSLARAKRNVIQPVFNEASLLERVDVWLERASEPAALLDPGSEAPSLVGVQNIDYDAKGQRVRIDCKNGASTLYTYDPLTFRLTQLVTQRNAVAFPGDDPQSPVAGWPGRQVQNLRYTYDPTRNITHIQDDAQQTIYFRNKRVEPSSDYTYDALYRLIQARGREHLGQGNAPIQHSHDDAGRVGLLAVDSAGRFAANDGTAMGTYTERYVYDAVGNFLQMQHRGDDPSNAGWTRRYTYSEDSLIESGKQNNRLTRTQVGNGASSVSEPYLHDVHGNMIRMPHLGGGFSGPNMHWDFRDRLRQADLGSATAAYYVYDSAGERTRKVWEKGPGLIEERIYIGGFEVFRKHGGAIAANSATLERETLHVMDDKQRIALVETRTLDTAGNDQAARQLIRYQFGNHLGSASLELDDEAQIISYEEYSPYGSSTYQAARSQTEAAKRYRYTGMERDEESGLNYNTARYYAPWLGRWTTCDPIGIESDLNLYLYCHANSVRFQDGEGTDPPADATSHVEVRPGGTLVTSQQIVREGLYSRLVTTFDPSAGGWSQKLYRRDDGLNPNWKDVTQQALGAGYLNPKGTPQGQLSVEWNMPSLGSADSRVGVGEKAGRIVSEMVVSEIPPSLVIPYVKDSILADHMEFTPPGENPYQHWADTIGRRWSATGARKTSFWLNKVVTVAGFGVGVGSTVNSTGKALSVIKATAEAEATAFKSATRLASRFDLGKSVASNKEMVAGVRELEAGFKNVAGTKLPAGHVLTDLQKRALEENVRRVITKTIEAVKTGSGKQALVNQLANPRFRFLYQVPSARAALIDALKGTGITLPPGL